MEEGDLSNAVLDQGDLGLDLGPEQYYTIRLKVFIVHILWKVQLDLPVVP